MFLPTLLASSTVTFSGVMPPHLANDGQIYVLQADATVSADAERTALRTCRVNDYKAVQGGYEFGVGPAQADAVKCLKADALAGERVTKAGGWN